jgi:hypothetical protein
VPLQAISRQITILNSCAAAPKLGDASIDAPAQTGPEWDAR